jgi:hypothetical protein
MRTKTLLLTAALSAAGIATSMAQAVYSVNAVGYVNTTLVPGFNLISNPLDNKTGNSINNLLVTGMTTVPDGTTAYVFQNGGFQVAQYDELDGRFNPAAIADLNILPGSGFFVRNPGSTSVQVTFVGEVPQGNLSQTIPPGFSIQASSVPIAGTASSMGLGGQNGDTYYGFSEANQSFNFISTFDDLDNAWSPALPVLQVGEAFMYLSRATAPRQWTRSFSVNN